MNQYERNELSARIRALEEYLRSLNPVSFDTPLTNYFDPTMLSALFDDKFVKENVVSESVNPDTLSN